MKVFTYQYQNYTHLFETAEAAYNTYLQACGINKIEPKPFNELKQDLIAYKQWKHVIDHFKIKSHCRKCNINNQYFNSFIISEKDVYKD